MSPPPADDATQRFTRRVEYYVRYRPGYPPAALASLRDEFGLQPRHVIADVGSGTGILSAALVADGNLVYGVEPNPEMRAAAERLLADHAGFHSIAGTAEATTLPDASVDWVMAAQAFHWFDVDAARREFRRILRLPLPLREGVGGGFESIAQNPLPALPLGGGGDLMAGRTANVALLWNNRREDTPFLREYEALLRAGGTDYSAIKHQHVETDGRLERFFAGSFALRSFANRQVLDFAGLCGRTLSASYVPTEDDPRWPALRARLRALFDRYADNGMVSFEYDTHLYIGAVR